MFTRQVICAILSLSLFLGFCSYETAKAQTQEEDELKELQELQNLIRRDKFDLILPQIMRERNIDMWIHVLREGIFHSFGHYIVSGFNAELGSNCGVFIFTDRGGDRIERAVLGRRWKGPESRVNNPNDVVEECGAYDIIAEAIDRRQVTSEHNMPGGPETEYDYRFKGIGEFIAERDPKRIALNYREKFGHHVGAPTNDGISHTDYILLTKELGDKYAKRLVSSEYLMYDYVSRPVESELEMYKKIRKWIDEDIERKFAEIVPGVTKRRNRVIQRGDFISISSGTEAEYDLPRDGPRRWKFGNFWELKVEYGYVLREGETEPPPELKKLWADGMKIRKVIEDNIKIGRTGSETWEILKPKLAEAGFIVNDRQQYYKHLDPEKTQVSIDLHAMGKGSYAPRIGTYGPDWHKDMTLQLYHHFVMEMFIYMPLPSGINEEDHLRLWFHDGAYLTERGVEYSSPPTSEIHLIR